MVALHRAESVNQRQQEEFKQIGSAGIARESELLRGRCEVQALEQSLSDHRRSRAALTAKLGEAKQIIESQGSAVSADARSAAEIYEMQTRMLARRDEWAREEARLQKLIDQSEAQTGRLRMEASMEKGKASSDHAEAVAKMRVELAEAARATADAILRERTEAETN